MKGIYLSRFVGNVLAFAIAVALIGLLFAALGHALDASASWVLSEVTW